MSSAYDPNFEFNAPKFHDFTATVEDDGADAWFDSQMAQEGSGVMAEIPVESGAVEQENADPNPHDSTQEPAEEDTVPMEAEEPALEAQKTRTPRAKTPKAKTPKAKTPKAKTPNAKTPKAKPEWKQAVGNGKTRDVSSKFAEDLLALAAFKANEAEIKHLAESTVAACAEELKHDEPVSARTRKSTGRGANDENVAPGDAPTTPGFSRFASGGRPASAMTPQSAPRPSSARTPSSSLTRGTAASSARSVQKAPRSSRKAPAAKPPTLTVPVTPKLRTSSRSRTSVGALESESSRESLGGVSQQGSRSSLSGLRLTVPKSPKLSTSRRASRSAMGTDDARMREAEAAVEQLKKRRKLGEQRMRGALDRAVPAGNTLRSAKQLTLPQSPALSKSRRSVAPSRSVDDLTEAIRATLTTSQRPATARARSPPREHAAPKLTEPKTPTFSSFHKKARRVKSFKEIEDEMVEDAKRNQFKARPVSKRALESFGDVGVPKVAKRELTVPVAPRLHTSDRSVSRSRDSSLNESLSESSVESFRAKSVPRRRPSAPPASSEPRALTIPVSPNFRTSVRQGRRSSASSLTSLDDLPLPAFKAAPAPDMRKRFVPKHETRPLTEPKPFNLSSSRRSIDSLSSVEQPKERKLAAKGPRGLTETRPFRLAGEERHEYYKQTWAAQVDRELEEERARFSSFHARGMPAAITDAKKVFTPRRSGKPLTEVQNVQLASDRRSLSRQAFDAERAKREAAAEEARLEDARRAAEQERREVRALRRSMVPRARAVPDAVFAPAAEVPDVAQPSPTPPLSLSPPARPPSRMTGGHGAPTRGAAGRQVARSVKPLTEPMSPHFRTDARLRASVH